MFNPCEVQRIMPLWKVSCPHHPKCPCDVILIDIVRGGHPSFSKCQVCFCVPYTISFVSFLVVQIIKHLHNTVLLWSISQMLSYFHLSLIFAMWNFKIFLTTIFLFDYSCASWRIFCTHNVPLGSISQILF